MDKKMNSKPVPALTVNEVQKQKAPNVWDVFASESTGFKLALNKALDLAAKVDSSMIDYEIQRNPIARGVVEMIMSTTWASTPRIVDNEREASETLEMMVNDHLEKIRFWEELEKADRISLRDGWAALVLEFGIDETSMDDLMNPIENLGQFGGIEAITSVFAVSEKSISYQEDTTGKYVDHYLYTSARQGYRLHPDRVIIVGEHGIGSKESMLKSI